MVFEIMALPARRAEGRTLPRPLFEIMAGSRAHFAAAAYMPIMVNSVLPTTARPHRPPPILICRKCLKRAANGRAIKRALKVELKALSRARGVKRPRVVMTGCFGICPKRAVTATSGAMLARGEFLLLADEVQAAAAAAGLVARDV
jgi:hypothetical protein